MKKIIVLILFIACIWVPNASNGNSVFYKAPCKNNLVPLKTTYSSSILLTTVHKKKGPGWYLATIDDITLSYQDDDSIIAISWPAMQPWEEVYHIENSTLLWYSLSYGSMGMRFERGPYKLFNNTNFTIRLTRPGYWKEVTFPITYWEPEIPPQN